jgi:hypothetical protein
MRIHLSNSFLWLLLLLLLSLLLFVYNANDLLLFSHFDRLRIAHRSSLNYSIKWGEIQTRLDRFEFAAAKRNEELQQLQQLFARIVHQTQNHDQSIGSNRLRSFESMSSDQLDLPSITAMLPQLKFFDGSIDPVFFRGNRTIARTSMVNIVFGIPTVARAIKSYLIETLTSLMSNLSEHQKKDARFVVFIAEVLRSNANSS